MAVAFVDDQECTGCEACVAICPESIIEMKEGVAFVKDGCTGCESCVVECPVEAIRMKD